MSTPKSNGEYLIEIITKLINSESENIDPNKIVNLYDDKRIILKLNPYKKLVLWLPYMFEEVGCELKDMKINRIDFEIHSVEKENLGSSPITHELSFDKSYVKSMTLKDDYTRTFEDYIIEQFENRLRENNQKRIIEIFEEIFLEVT